MSSYAQSNIQLFNHMREAGYSQTEILAARDAYRCAMGLFTCRFEPSGRVFLAHIVRTAGILVALRAPTPVVLAGLLHNAYQNGDFGDGVSGSTPVKRQAIRKVVGDEVESYIAGFANQPWNAKTLQTLRDNLQRDGLESFSLLKRNVILIKIADHLEHELDLDPLYVIKNRYQALTRDAGAAIIEIAELLDYPTLAAELRRTSEELETAKVPVELRSEKTRSELFIPASSCIRFPVAVHSFYLHTRRQLSPLRHRCRAAFTRRSS